MPTPDERADMNELSPSWSSKFRVAFSGLFWALKTQTSFRIHLPIAAAVLVTSALLQVEAWRWSVLVLTIAVVVAAELINTAIETLVRVLHPHRHELVGRSLDAAAAAVLVLSIAAIAVGLLVLGPPLYESLAFH
ncbi:Undecaprenol kinase [Rubripirellula amarantea]|uniref:Undecaprenol kinase n=1 Tax=Rubripirellula amarantea TaxID=2527999 RepID=A0A5C5WTN7_9BACT|nr:diacylglycerol kinase [Rubripirellula amarantea]TWT54037.1 Undecaprenol kinase [Rubripirellula amarantea]